LSAAIKRATVIQQESGQKKRWTVNHHQQTPCACIKFPICLLFMRQIQSGIWCCFMFAGYGNQHEKKLIPALTGMSFFVKSALRL
jgi:hypothetical protein